MRRLLLRIVAGSALLTAGIGGALVVGWLHERPAAGTIGSRVALVCLTLVVVGFILQEHRNSWQRPRFQAIVATMLIAHALVIAFWDFDSIRIPWLVIGAVSETLVLSAALTRLEFD